MALSGSRDFKLNRNQLIYRALELAGVYSENENPSSFQVNSASDFLNMLIKHWQSDGLQLWMRREITVFLEKSKQSYLIGPSGTYATSDSDYVGTTITSDLVATDTVIAVTSSTGMSVSDNIGIRQDDDTIHWDTIASVDSSTQVTITNGVASAATSGNKVWAYTNIAFRPLLTLSGFYRDTSNNDTPVRTDMSQDEYRNLTQKSSSGSPINSHYDPQLTNGVLYVWPVSSYNDYLMKLLVAKPYDDVDNSTDDFEFPQEWFLALTYNLAVEIGNTDKIPDNVYGRLSRRAERLKMDLDSFDVENTSIYLQPERSY